MDLILTLLINAVALMAGAHLLKGVDVEDFARALIVAVALALLNATLGNILDFITTPLRFLTLGLFSFVVDGAMLLIAAYFLKGFTVQNFGSAFLLALIMAVVNTLLHGLL
ncbi:phage holin family protein [Phaeodactylibacter luteus]|uniref:Phage holin family protein n=1 Tax=Phaeodactylibacter luteus TaxID=1564516 RepID=A0A5C6RP88_9BACT|nr:phage holin family protein [Phaeodactylibacter luteus]TXB64148.1 phage holin family protein [Phaeodactylibacter luteus]